MKNPARFSRLIVLAIVLASVLTLGCITLTLSTTIVSPLADEITQDPALHTPLSLGMDMVMDFDPAVFRALEDIQPGAASTVANNMRAQWTVETSDGGRVIHASRPLTDIQSKPAEWNIEIQPVPADVNAGTEPNAAQILTATLNIERMFGEQDTGGAIIKNIYVELDESYPYGTRFLYHAEVVIAEPDEQEPEGGNTESQWSRMVDDFLQPDREKLIALDEAIKRAAAPKLVVTTDLPLPIFFATLNGEPGGVISGEKREHVEWTLLADVPGTLCHHRVRREFTVLVHPERLCPGTDL